MKFFYLKSNDRPIIVENLYTVRHKIEYWIPSLKIYEYDEELSMQVLLNGRKLDDLSKPAVEPYGANVYQNEADRLLTIVKAMTIKNCEPDDVLPYVCDYFLARLAVIFAWNFKTSKSDKPQQMQTFIHTCGENYNSPLSNFRKMYRYFDADIFNCIAIAQLRDGANANEVINAIVYHLYCERISCCYPLDNFRDGFLLHEFVHIFTNVIGSAYQLDKFSASSMFLKAEKFASFDSSSLRFELEQMGDVYLPRDEALAMAEVLSLNQTIEKVREITPQIPKFEIDPEAILFRNKTKRFQNYCYFDFMPYTKTKKLSKYPLTLNLYCYEKTDNHSITAQIDLNQKSELSRGKLVLMHSGEKYSITLKDECEIFKIEHRSVGGHLTELYKNL